MDDSGGDGVRFRHRGEILLAGVALSFSGLVLRQIESADPWQIMFYRSIFLCLCLGLYLQWRHPGGLAANLRGAGAGALLGGFCLAVAMTGFVWSVTHTTVANTLFIMAAAPFFSAVLGWLLIRERVLGRTWATMALAGVGILVMVGNGLVLGHLPGQLAALATTLAIACFNVVLRWRRHVELLSAAIYAGLFSIVGAGLVSAPRGLAIAPVDVLWCALYGGPVMLLGLGFYIHGGRYVPAAEISLLSLSEVALGPLWVWLAIDEEPTLPTLVGGAVVLAAVVAQILLGGRPRPRAAALD